MAVRSDNSDAPVHPNQRYKVENVLSTTTPQTERMSHWVAGTAIFLAVLAGIAAVRVGEPALLLLPAALIAVPVLAPRFLRDPIPLFCVFMIAVANLSFFDIVDGVSTDVVVSAVLLWALLIRGGLKGQIVGTSAIERALLIVLTVFAITIVISVDPALSLRKWIREFQYLVFFAFVLHRPLSEREETWIVRACLISVVIPTLAGLVGLIFGVEVFAGAGLQSELSEESLTRIRGTQSHPVTLSIFLGFFAVLLSSLIQKRQYGSRLLIGSLLALALVGEYFTYGRSGWFGLAIALAALIWLQGRRWLLIVGAPIVVIGLFALLPTLQERVISSATSGNDNSFFWRIRLWMYALDFFPQRPIWGSGLGTFLDYVSFSKGFGAHSTWVGLLIESGVVGLTAFVALMVTTWAKFWKTYREHPPGTDLFLEGIMAGFILMMISSIAASTWTLASIVVYFWVLAAVALHPDRRARLAASVASGGKEA